MTSILKVSEIQDPTNGNSALTIDSSGRIFTPARPMFQVVKTGTDQSVTNGVATKIDWTTAITDVGGHFSIANNEYTIPVSGMYNIQCCLRGSGTAGTLDNVIIYLYSGSTMIKNLGQLNIRNNHLANSHVNGSVNLYLSAGENICFYGTVSGSGTKFGADGRYTFCSGFLIG